MSRERRRAPGVRRRGRVEVAAYRGAAAPVSSASSAERRGRRRRPGWPQPGEAAADHDAGHGRADRLADRRPDHALEAVDRQQVRLGHQRGQPGGVGRVVERHGHAGRRSATAARCQSWVRSVSDSSATSADAAELDRRDGDAGSSSAGPGRRPRRRAGTGSARRARWRRRDQRELARAATDADDLPDQRDHPHAPGEGGEHERDGQPAVGRRAERRQRARQGSPDRLRRLGWPAPCVRMSVMSPPHADSVSYRPDSGERIHRSHPWDNLNRGSGQPGPVDELSGKGVISGSLGAHDEEEAPS